MTTQNLRLFMARQEKTSRAALSMMGLFLLCYGPSAILIYTMNFCSTCSCVDIHWMRDWSALTVMMNSAFDPFLYCYRIQQYKKTVIKILGCRKNRVVQLETSTAAAGTSSLDRQPSLSCVDVEESQF